MNFWTNKNVLITGAAGFIGSFLSKKLSSFGCKLRLVDNLERGKLKDIAGNQNAKIIIGDLRSLDFCKSICKDINIVIHLASKVGGINYYLFNPYEVFTNNLLIDSNILNALLEEEGVKYFFYASSAHIYPHELQMERVNIISEERAYPANPCLSYGWAKLIFEKKLEFLIQEKNDINVAIARYIGIYGPGQNFNLDKGSVIPVFTYRSIKYPEIPFKILGTGEETRTYCFISDAINCTQLMIEEMQNQQFVGPYNVGTQEKYKIVDIAKKIIDISGKKIDIEFDLSHKTLIWNQVCDCSRVQKELNWKPMVDFDLGLKYIYEDIKNRILYI